VSWHRHGSGSDERACRRRGRRRIYIEREFTDHAACPLIVSRSIPGTHQASPGSYTLRNWSLRGNRSLLQPNWPRYRIVATSCKMCGAMRSRASRGLLIPDLLALEIEGREINTRWIAVCTQKIIITMPRCFFQHDCTGSDRVDHNCPADRGGLGRGGNPQGATVQVEAHLVEVCRLCRSGFRQ
jgi:hypothetical protein